MPLAAAKERDADYFYKYISIHWGGLAPWFVFACVYLHIYMYTYTLRVELFRIFHGFSRFSLYKNHVGYGLPRTRE